MKKVVEVNTVARFGKSNVVVGNPPYSVDGTSRSAGKSDTEGYWGGIVYLESAGSVFDFDKWMLYPLNSDGTIDVVNGVDGDCVDDKWLGKLSDSDSQLFDKVFYKPVDPAVERAYKLNNTLK